MARGAGSSTARRSRAPLPPPEHWQEGEATMSDPNHGAPGAAHAAALAALEPFLQRLLPAMLRCNRRWRRLPEPSRRDLIGDLRQELRLDCLEHLPVVLQLPQRERHQRWFRLVERWIYRHGPSAAAATIDREPSVPDGT